MNVTIYGNELYHHGIKGQKWGLRRYQNEDGTLTPEGREHYGYGKISLTKDKDKNWTVSDDKRKANISEKQLRDMEKGADKNAETAAALYLLSFGIDPTEITIDEIDKVISSTLADDVNEMIDEVLEEKLSDFLDEYGTYTNKDNSKNSIKEYKDRYSKAKFTSEEAMDQADKDLEEIYPDFYKKSDREQIELWMDYVNETGLYKYI